LGHRRIAFVAGASRTNPAKISGYTRAMDGAGLGGALAVIETAVPPGATRRFVVEHADLFRSPTAVLASNDRIAAELVFGLQDLGLCVPEDVSVVGYDDTPISTAISPTLTTIRQPRQEVGDHAVRMVLDLIAGRQVENVVLKPELIVRESTGPCRRA
jgi:DNA-binding LacI/PurR family transcriptional regulator